MALAAAMINEIALALEEFGARGLSPFMDEWQDADDLIDRCAMPHGTVNDPHVFISITKDGTVTIFCHRSASPIGRSDICCASRPPSTVKIEPVE